MGLPKLKIPPEFCYYAFNDKKPEAIPNLWAQVQKDRGELHEFEISFSVPQGLKDLLIGIEDRSLNKADVLEKMHEVFSAALMLGYEKMEDLVENTGACDRVNEVRNILIPFLPEKMKPFVPDHQRINSPATLPRGGGRMRRP